MKSALFIVLALALAGEALAINCGDEALPVGAACCKDSNGQCSIVPAEVNNAGAYCRGPLDGQLVAEDEDCENDAVEYSAALGRPVSTSNAHDDDVLEILRRGEGVVAPLTVHHDAGDGNCHFRAISYQLWGTEGHHLELRGIAMDYIEANSMTYRYALGAHLNAGYRDDQWDQYIRDNRQSARHGGDYQRYGGDETASALSRALGLEIYVVKTDRQLASHTPPGPPAVNKKVFIIHTGNHYNDVQYGGGDEEAPREKQRLRRSFRAPVKSSCDQEVRKMFEESSGGSFEQLCEILRCEEGACAAKEEEAAPAVKLINCDKQAYEMIKGNVITDVNEACKMSCQSDVDGCIRRVKAAL